MDSESSINDFMSISQSPSKITEFSSNSSANSRALATTIVFVSNAVSVRGIGWHKDAITKPLQSHIMTPTSTLSKEVNNAPSKFIL